MKNLFSGQTPPPSPEDVNGKKERKKERKRERKKERKKGRKEE